MAELTHDRLPCGIEYAVNPLPRHVVSFQIRMLTGTSNEPTDKLGLARLVESTLDKGTAKRSGRELSDAFDAIGASAGSGTGRETTTFSCTVLPEHFDKAVELHAEFLRTPTFPKDAVDVAIELSRQELIALDDDARGLSDKYLSIDAFGPILGRHPIGEAKTLGSITVDDFTGFWRDHFHCGRMMVSVAGAVDSAEAASVFEKHFSGFGDGQTAGRESHPAKFFPGEKHYPKELEQEHIGIGFPGVDATHEDFPTQQIMLGILSGGMGARLFTEVREKQGLVYWVSAWHETPRGCGMIFLGASTTPERCEKTYTTLLREVDRLAEDVEQDELDRAITGIVSRRETRGDTTRALCGELGSDLFHFGRPMSPEEKLAKIKAVTIDDVRRYLATYSRKELCVVTLGPKPLHESTPEATVANLGGGTAR